MPFARANAQHWFEEAFRNVTASVSLISIVMRPFLKKRRLPSSVPAINYQTEATVNNLTTYKKKRFAHETKLYLVVAVVVRVDKR